MSIVPSRLIALTLALLVTLVTAQRSLAEPLHRVQAKRVCMVNDTAFPKDQIPVKVGKETYFGCCQMCEGRLANDPAVRHATDPVSGKPVDKAKAVIGVKPDGKVLYFESEKTFAAFGKRS
jgi:YHS domain-containing protein